MCGTILLLRLSGKLFLLAGNLALSFGVCRCRFEGANGRWARGPLKPNVSSVVQVCGPLAGIFAPGHIELTIEHIVLSLGLNTDAPTASASPSKKRKYAAAVPPTNPLTSPSAVEVTAQGLTPIATTSATPMAVVADAAALSEVELALSPSADPTSSLGPAATTPPKPSKGKGKGKGKGKSSNI